MKKVILPIVLWKKEGETPLEALEAFRHWHKDYKDVPMTYAGRLDPMASGLLIILAGEEVKNKEKYLKLDKEYEFEILFSFATDTHDVLGKVTEYKAGKVTEKEIKNNLKYFIGKFKQKYPLYSSKTIKSARAGIEVEAADREVKVRSLKFTGLKTVSGAALLKSNIKRINKVKGDFRQKEILKLWSEYLRTRMLKRFPVASFKIKCSSGTYVRAVSNDLGVRMRVPALALRIKRTKIGKWSNI